MTGIPPAVQLTTGLLDENGKPLQQPGSAAATPSTVAPNTTGLPSSPTTVTPPAFTPTDSSVQTQLTGLLSKGSPLLTQARTRAKKASNRRGLINSSIGVQAGEAAAYDVALPIASQQAQQIHQSNLTGTDIASKEKIAFANIAAHDREKATSAAVAMENIYGEGFRTLASNENLPAEARNAYLQHYGAIRDSNMNLIEQLYGIDLSWATPADPANPNAPAPGETGAGTNTGTPVNTPPTGGGDNNDDDDDDDGEDEDEDDDTDGTDDDDDDDDD